MFDEVLLYLAETGEEGEVLRFWESLDLFVVLGRISNPFDDLNIDSTRRDDILVLRRSSGGGTVLQGRGCLNYSLVLSKERNPQLQVLRASYEFILGKIISALKKISVGAVFKPISDIAAAADEKKFSGNAQRRGRKFILHHGTILYDFDLTLIEKYLKMPKQVPEYRRNRSHSEFLTNIPILPKEFKEALKDVFGVRQVQKHLTPREEVCLNDFLRTKRHAVDISSD